MTVTAEDLDGCVAACAATLRAGADAEWTRPAGDLEWTCWETIEHLADDLFHDAIHLADGHPDRWLPIEDRARRPGGPRNAVHVDPADGPDLLVDSLVGCGALLAAVVRTAPAGQRGRHNCGPADAGASAAMGMLEALVHTHDVTAGLGLPWSPDPGHCTRVLGRLMPEVEPAADPWATLLWATGRVALPGRPRRSSWQWTN